MLRYRAVYARINFSHFNGVNYAVLEKYLLAFVTSLMIGVMGVSGCKEKAPAEEAGEAVDEAAQDAKRKIDDATD